MNHPHLIKKPYDVIMDIAGFEGINAFSESLGGMTIYIPSMRKIILDCIVEEVRKNYDGKNYNRLADKYGISARQLRRMVSGEA